MSTAYRYLPNECRASKDKVFGLTVGRIRLNLRTVAKSVLLQWGYPVTNDVCAFFFRMLSGARLPL